MSTEIKYYSNESEKSMDIETIKKDFLFTIDEEFGCVYYLPQKRLAKIDRNTAKNLKDCQDGKTELTDAYENLLEKFKKNQSVHQSVSEDNVKVIHKLEIMVCTTCNLNCVYCYANGGNYYGEEQMLSYEVVDALVRYLKQEQIKVEMVQFFGGEPALGYKMISYICKKFKENDILVQNYGMVTNFTFLPEELLDDIVKYGINLTVSIDGPKEITNEQRISRTQNMDVYDTIVKNLNRLRKRERDVSAIECTCTDLYKKLGYTEQTLKKFFHEELSVENIMLETANDIYGSDEKLINSEMYFKENLSFIEEMQFLQMLYDEKKQNTVFCRAGLNNYAVFPNGDIYPCHMFVLLKEKYRMGNILDEAWDKRQQFSEVVCQLKKLQSAYRCKECNGRNFCHQCVAEVALNKNIIDCSKRVSFYSETINNYVKNKCINLK